MIAKSHRWQKTVLAAAASALFGLVGTNAFALSLGRISVQSALGEPLRAEVDIPDINAEEAASLKAVVAKPAAFQAAGLEYNPALGSLKASLQTRANGRAFLRLSSERAISEPFVDVILEATWASGRIVRDYTMLFDPVTLKKPAPIAIAPSPIQPPATATAPRAPTPAAVASVGPVRTEIQKQERPATPKPAAAPKPDETPQQIKVRSGETASGIAGRILPANVSLDQMLVALLRANPDAFIRDNVNRMKAGVILEVPTEAQASALSESQASQVIIAQSRDFNDYRRKLATNAPQAEQAPAARQTSGLVQAQVEDKKAEVPTPDKLTLSKTSVEAKLAAEQMVRERAAAEASERAAELKKNINDLGKLGVPATSAAVSPAPSTEPAAPVPDPVPATVAVPVTAPDAPPKEAPPVEPAATPAVVPPVATPTPAEEPSFIDGLIENPLIPIGAIGLIALLAGLGVYRVRQRKDKDHVDSSFMESHLKPESFFGASGGQSVDTNDSGMSGSSMVYSPSQLVADDVDPVAEADVYLAYGRDLQAEEILREALRTQPGRIAIHQKLVDILAKRNDVHGLEEVAALGFKVTGGVGAEWARICELGLAIDPTNDLYQPGGHPSVSGHGTAAIADTEATADTNDNIDSFKGSFAHELSEVEPVAQENNGVDLDLDFSFDEEPVSQITEATPSQLAPIAELPTLDFDANALDSTPMTLEFELPTEVVPPSPTASIENSGPDLDLSALDDMAAPPHELDLSFDSEEFKVQAANSFGATSLGELPSEESKKAHESDLSMLDFDLGSLSLDMNPVDANDANAAPVEHEDPLMTKLALAEEFSAIGDDDGARALIEEVLSEATGDLKAKAQRALNNL